MTTTPLRRLLPAVFISIGLMLADVVALVLVTRASLPHKPPMWATAPFFWVLAWPVPLFVKLFPQPSGSPDHGPAFVAVACAGLIDLILLVLLVDYLRRRRLG